MESLKGVTIVVVDDDQDVRECVDQTLAFIGADVRTAATVAEAVQLLREGRR